MPDDHEQNRGAVAPVTPPEPPLDGARIGDYAFSQAFLAVASHELRTPMQAIGLNLAMMRSRIESSADEVPRRWLVERLRRTQRLLDQMVRLVDGLLGMGEISSGHLRLRRETFDLAELTRGIVADAADRLQWARCLCDVVAPVPVIGCWDRFRVAMIVENLLSNAVKYAAGCPIHVRVSIQEDEAHLVVEDEGPGIAPEDRARVFERFERGARPGSSSGFGLGLWIVRAIAEAHGGSVALLGGRGATFVVSLPLGAAPAPGGAL
ncbi:MAG TPA: HAMP domain-containing sensor histidine kinase [Anaeromyxobacter sp.]|nr:HAMP domain-containing sensor histidine kinase [Anaeromyxobacter sp.]